MYERNYKDGNGTEHAVGGLMGKNVTAYSDGAKAKKEAKWMSDGTQFNDDMSFEKTADDSTDLKSAESSSVEVVEEVNESDISLEVTAVEDSFNIPSKSIRDSIAQ